MIQQNLRHQAFPPETLRRIALVDGDKNNHLTVEQAFAGESAKWVLEYHTHTKEALGRISLVPPHIVIMELNFPDSSGMDFLVKLKARLPDLLILMFTGCHQQHEVELCLMAGANGFLVKPIQKCELLRLLGEAVVGRAALCENAQAAMLDPYQRVSRLDLFQNLGLCERVILVYLLQGFSKKEIALHQKKPTDTVHTHQVNLYHKLGVHSRAELLKKFSGAMRNN